jgi:hypothetical protein|tara:strand:- start:151 stop:408 length:258 start_codon:yes stop_codon:yes gene_type:complete
MTVLMMTVVQLAGLVMAMQMAQINLMVATLPAMIVMVVILQQTVKVHVKAQLLMMNAVNVVVMAVPVPVMQQTVPVLVLTAMKAG